MNFDVVIAGGGASGTLVAAQLARKAVRPLSVAIVERKPALGRGVAYATDRDDHLLNVPAGRMSALPEDPGHFVRWLAANGNLSGASAFVPRRWYGEYLAGFLHDSISGGRATLRRIHGTLESGESAPHAGFVVSLAGGVRLETPTLVLASGNPAPDSPGVPELEASARYRPDPWSSKALLRIAVDAPVLLIGTGLTMVDLALELESRGHRGAIHAISRRGLLPAAHDLTVLPRTGAAVSVHARTTVRGILRDLRRDADLSSWRAAVDAIRPVTSKLWAGLSLAERRRFLRHARRYWDAHRHRMPPPSAERISAMIARGALTIHAGRVRGLEDDRIRFSNAKGESTIRAARVVNCIGLSASPARDPFLSSLAASGLVRPDPLHLGISPVAPGVLSLGSLRRGELWETTAIPEIREQAAAIAADVLEWLGPAPRAKRERQASLVPQ